MGTNNPPLWHQLEYSFRQPDEKWEVRILRPHNRYMNVYYTPKVATQKDGFVHHHFAFVSRTKFQWVTMECLLKRMIAQDSLPLSFETLNTLSSKSFNELAAFTAVVLVPWEAALMAFYEYYSMG